MDVSIILTDRDPISDDSDARQYFDGSAAVVVHIGHRNDVISVHVLDAAQADRMAALFTDAARLLRVARGEAIEPARCLCPHCGIALEASGLCPRGILAAADRVASFAGDDDHAMAVPAVVSRVMASAGCDDSTLAVAAERDLCPHCGLSDDGCDCRYVLSELGERVLGAPAAGDVPAIVAEACAADLVAANR